MTASELIDQLERFRKQHGDLEVRMPAEIVADNEEDDTASICGAAMFAGENDEPDFFLLCDLVTTECLASTADTVQ